MCGSTLDFQHAGDEFATGPFGNLAATVLERRRSSRAPIGTEADWCTTQAAVAGATSRGRLFPSLVGPIRSTEGAVQTIAWHRLPDVFGISLDGNWRGPFSAQVQVGSASVAPTSANRSCPIEMADLLRGAYVLATDAWTELVEGRLGVEGDLVAGTIYAPGIAVWLLPGNWARCVDDATCDARDAPAREAAATRFLARTLGGLFQSLEPRLPHGPGLDSLRALGDDWRRNLTHRTGPGNWVVASLRQLLQQLNVAPTSAVTTEIHRPPHEYVTTGDYRKLDDHWLFHPRLGVKRYAIVPMHKVGGRVPAPGDINRELAKRGDLRILDARMTKNKDGVLFVLSASSGDPTAITNLLVSDMLVPAVATATPAPSAIRNMGQRLDWVRLIEDDRGVCCTWKARTEPDARFHLWWSDAPLEFDSWEALEASSAKTQVLDAGQRQFVIEVDSPQIIYAALGIERQGERSAVKRADASCRARPPRATAAPVAAPPSTAAISVAAPPAASAAREDSPPRNCPGCRAEVPSGRKFCPKCGGAMTSRESIREDDVTSTTGAGDAGRTAPEQVRLLEREGQVVRSLVRIAGGEQELLACPAASEVARFWEAMSAAPTANLAGLPRLEARESRDSGRQLFFDAQGVAAPTWNDYSAQIADHDRLWASLTTITRQSLLALQELHSRGWSYGRMFPEHLRVMTDSATVRLAWPIAPLELGRPAAVVHCPTGYVCPEYGQLDEPVAPHWDLYSLGVTLFWGLAKMAPPESLSNATLPELNPRVYVPDLPAGWGGLFARLLSKRKERRFAKVDAALAALDHLTEAGAPVTSVRVAAGLHVGATKVLLNPRNQDRWVCSGPAGNIESATRQPFEAYDAAESYTTQCVDLSLPVAAAVADGVSTVDCGEFASASICRTIDEFGRQELETVTSPGDALVALADRTNRRLGVAVQEEVARDPARSRWLAPYGIPSSTLAALMFAAGKTAVVGVGDSRAYLLRNGLLEQLTVDGDQLTEYLRQGLDLSESLQRDDFKEIVGWIGRFEIAEGELRADRPIDVSRLPGFWHFEFTPQVGDVLLVCTDGLSDFVDGGRIDLTDVLTRFTPEEAARALVDAANACGGLDNIGLLVVHASGGTADAGVSPGAP